MMACSEATSSCHWLRTWSMASCLVFSDTVATALIVSISARAWASWAWMELSSAWAPSSTAFCLFSSSGEQWDGSKMTWIMEGASQMSKCARKERRGIRGMHTKAQYCKRQKTHKMMVYHYYPYLLSTGRALWTWLVSGWTRSPAAAWVWWTQPSLAPELPLAAGAPLNYGENKQNKGLQFINCLLNVDKNLKMK